MDIRRVAFLHFPDPVTEAIDEERRRKFEAGGQMYQSQFTLVVTWLPPRANAKKFTDLMYEVTGRREMRANKRSRSSSNLNARLRRSNRAWRRRSLCGT